MLTAHCLPAPTSLPRPLHCSERQECPTHTSPLTACGPSQAPEGLLGPSRSPGQAASCHHKNNFVPIRQISVFLKALCCQQPESCLNNDRSAMAVIWRATPGIVPGACTATAPGKSPDRSCPFRLPHLCAGSPCPSSVLRGCSKDSSGCPGGIKPSLLHAPEH